MEWSTISTVDAVILKEYQRLVTMLLGAQGSHHIFRAVHDAAALIIEAEDAGHTVSALGTLQRRGHRL